MSLHCPLSQGELDMPYMRPVPLQAMRSGPEHSALHTVAPSGRDPPFFLVSQWLYLAHCEALKLLRGHLLTTVLNPSSNPAGVWGAAVTLPHLDTDRRCACCASGTHRPVAVRQSSQMSVGRERESLFPVLPHPAGLLEAAREDLGLLGTSSPAVAWGACPLVGSREAR